MKDSSEAGCGWRHPSHSSWTSLSWRSGFMDIHPVQNSRRWQRVTYATPLAAVVTVIWLTRDPLQPFELFHADSMPFAQALQAQSPYQSNPQLFAETVWLVRMRPRAVHTQHRCDLPCKPYTPAPNFSRVLNSATLGISLFPLSLKPWSPLTIRSGPISHSFFSRIGGWTAFPKIAGLVFDWTGH
jgi:hypothetical protein